MAAGEPEVVLAAFLGVTEDLRGTVDRNKDLLHDPTVGVAEVVARVPIDMKCACKPSERCANCGIAGGLLKTQDLVVARFFDALKQGLGSLQAPMNLRWHGLSVGFTGTIPASSGI